MHEGSHVLNCGPGSRLYGRPDDGTQKCYPTYNLTSPELYEFAQFLLDPKDLPKMRAKEKARISTSFEPQSVRQQTGRRLKRTRPKPRQEQGRQRKMPCLRWQQRNESTEKQMLWTGRIRTRRNSLTRPSRSSTRRMQLRQRPTRMRRKRGWTRMQQRSKRPGRRR